MEILETGALRRIGYERTEDVEVTRLFQGIYGVGMLLQPFHLTCFELIDWIPGQSTAFKWYSAGCRTLDDLTAGKGGVTLSTVQEIGIHFYDGQRSMRRICTALTLPSLSPQISTIVCPGKKPKPYLI
jgi:DNA polymerase lambda